MKKVKLALVGKEGRYKKRWRNFFFFNSSPQNPVNPVRAYKL